MGKKKKIILIVVSVVVIIIIGGILASNRKNKVEYQTVKVERKDLVQTVEATGEVKSADYIDLNFKTSGRVSKINVKEGDIVKTGAILANLENTKENSQILSAQSQLISAKAELEKLLSGASFADISVSEATVAQKQQDLETAKNNLSNTEKTKEIEIDNLKETALTIINNELATAQGSLSTIDNVLNDNDLSYTFGILNRTSIDDAKNSREIANNLWGDISLKISAISADSLEYDIIDKLDDEILMLDSVAYTTNKVLTALQNSTTSNNITQTELDAFKTNIKAEQIKINSSRTSAVSTKNNLSSKIIYYSDLLNQKKDAVNSAYLSLSAAEAQLTLKKEPARPFETEIAKSKIKQAEANLLSAQSQFNDTIIKAPINGVITKIIPKNGELVSPSLSVMKILGEAKFEVDIDVPESDITKLSMGQKAELSFDALGFDKKFEASVFSIEVAETKIQDVVYYKVKILFNENQDEIKPGMTANATIFTAQKIGVLVVPARAIKSNDEKYVEILKDDNTIERRVVKTGLRGDDGVEIVEGLNEGEIIITFTKK
jgi:RND family efflux transporter MFP subunit